MEKFYCETHRYNPPKDSGLAFCPQCEFPEALHPSEIGAELYHVEVLPQATRAPQFVGFQCFCCGQRHPDLEALVACHSQLQAFYQQKGWLKAA